MLGVEKKQAYLLASGTAICGGTAMAAVAPSIKAKPEDLTTTLSIVFLLNAVAVITFPLIGDWFNLSQEQFGTWAALAIHDTASVVGAASVVGFDAVEVAATLKLARTLWIVPLVLLSAWYFKFRKARICFSSIHYILCFRCDLKYNNESSRRSFVFFEMLINIPLAVCSA